MKIEGANLGHKNREIEEIREAKNRVKLKKSVFSTKKEFKSIFNDFMAPRHTDLNKKKTLLMEQSKMNTV